MSDEEKIQVRIFAVQQAVGIAGLVGLEMPAGDTVVRDARLIEAYIIGVPDQPGGDQ